MYPFIEKYDESKEQQLVLEACEGSITAMEKLIKFHQRFIYNVALKLVKDADDAADLTQEILIKMVTKLSQYQHKSSFRTWLYRMVMNHFISSRRKKSEKQIYYFDDLGVYIDEVHNDEDMDMEEQLEYSDYITSVRDNCMSSMLLCLDKQQRVIFVLGGVFNLKSTVAAPLLDITPENFRKQLSRAKADLFQFMDNKCGLMNPANPCRCYKKTKGFMNEGKIDVSTHVFKPEYIESIKSVSETKNEELDDLMEHKYMQFFTDQVYEDTRVGDKLIETLLFDPDIKKLFHLN
ncbi:RNA polymerase sigma factor [Mucilaginibacter sabulilitoris]|uniref:RNA polymerase sigma factor n=1 Tax=Mucilaginibacter sabulilitoris TaxID=1173583 RepID=A0ABZ0TUF4_9SPHI|nr:RNA polymerase sigma factor [Mucilaginibacter sabulilitoris]WPU96381.1 RNA polymerase sigma factor [Mucilaginibacter sabulilitoris]